VENKVYVELKGKEIVALGGLICLAVLIATGHDSLLETLFVSAFVAYAGIDRIVQVRKRGKRE